MKKHTKQIISGITLFILGGIIIPTVFSAIVILYAISSKPLAKFTIPGQATVNIEKQGKYYLWNDYQTVFDGKTYFNSEDMPHGLDISLLEKQEGDSVEFIFEQSISSSRGESHKNSIGYFEITKPGTYILSVLGESEPRVCSLGTSIYNLRNVFVFLGTSCLAGVMGITGFVLVLVGFIGFVKDNNQKKSASSAASVVN